MPGTTCPLADGRSLGYITYGPENGRPVLYFHGTPSSRLEPGIAALYGVDVNGLLHRYGLRLVAVDRPGMGLSDYDPERTLLSFAADVQQLLAHLQIQSCPVLCWSGGGPYALTLAHRFPHIAAGVYIIAGFSSSFSDPEVYAKMGWNKMYFNTARQLPLALEGTLELVKQVTIQSPISQSLYELADADYAFLEDPGQLNAFLDLTVREACRTANKGAVQEAALYFQPYPYTLDRIVVPVHFWWGTYDNVVTYIHARNMERNLPGVVPHYKQNEGHVSIYVNCLEEVLHTIANGQ